MNRLYEVASQSVMDVSITDGFILSPVLYNALLHLETWTDIMFYVTWPYEVIPWSIISR